MRVAVVIPAYNESATIAAVVGGVCRHVPSVIVVDDGSGDDTAKCLAGLPVTVLRHASNRGKAASLWDGIQLALARGAQAVLTLDADGQHRPDDIPRLLAAGRRWSRHIIVAARVNDRRVVPGSRRFANWMADFWISWAAGLPIRDTQSGFRLYPAEALKRVRVAHGRWHGFVFESEVLIEAARQGYYTKSISIDAVYRPGARASYYRPAVDTTRIVLMVAWKLISRGLYPQGLLRSLGLWPSRGMARSGRVRDS
jgi:glycosyltransferase involved in cell wall biosynthesis